MFQLASILPIDEITTWAHDFGAKVLVDACQSVPHMVVDVQRLNVDFLVASSHKVRSLQIYCKTKLIDEFLKLKIKMLQMCGPTGIGFLYGKSELLSAMPPFLGNADYILLMCKICCV